MSKNQLQATSYKLRLARIKGVVNVWLLKRKANKLAKKSGIQHFVVRWQGKPEILSKDGFQYLRQHGYFPLKFTATELKKIAIYHTK